MPILHHDRFVAPGADPDRWMLFMHGIYGSGRNWASAARRWVRDRPAWGALTVDLRQHGSSGVFSPPHTIAACARDVAELLSSERLSAGALLGHSFGGKVALELARDPSRSLERIWIVDSTPDAGDPAGSPWSMLGALRRHPGPFERRGDAQRSVEDEGFPPPTARWMATNLERDDDEYRWRIDADDMEALLRDFFRTDAWDAVEAASEGTELHFLRATESSVMSAEAAARVVAVGQRTGRVFLHSVEGGHWLHTDNPEGLHRLLVAHTPTESGP